MRPEHLILDPEGGVAAEMVAVEPTGSETQVMMRLDGHPLVGVFRESAAARPGETVRVTT